MRLKLAACGLLMLLVLNACLLPKKVVYVKNLTLDSAYSVMAMPPMKLQKNDRLSIVIRAKNAELTAPFNSEGGFYNVNGRGEVTAANSSPGSTERGYLIDQQGNIEFPILGTIHAEGQTTEQLKEYIRGQLISRKLIDAPSVKVELLNLKIMMMGEIGRVGQLNVPDGRITLLEALIQSGGLTANAATNEVMVIRETNGVRKMYANNIEDKAIFNSPTYYLQQNDIVYVRPAAAVSGVRDQNGWRYISLFTGMLTLALSLIAILRK